MLEIPGGLPAIIRILRQAGLHHTLKRRRGHRLEFVNLPRFTGENRRGHAGRTLPIEREVACDHLVEHATKRENVGACIGRLAFHLFRSHVPRRAEYDALAGKRVRQGGFESRPRPAGVQFRQPEIEQLHA